jgi:hypothetical protein
MARRAFLERTAMAQLGVKLEGAFRASTNDGSALDWMLLLLLLVVVNEQMLACSRCWTFHTRDWQLQQSKIIIPTAMLGCLIGSSLNQHYGHKLLILSMVNFGLGCLWKIWIHD